MLLSRILNLEGYIVVPTLFIFEIFSIVFHKYCQKISILSVLNLRLKFARFYDLEVILLIWLSQKNRGAKGLSTKHSQNFSIEQKINF